MATIILTSGYAYWTPTDCGDIEGRVDRALNDDERFITCADTYGENNDEVAIRADLVAVVKP